LKENPTVSMINTLRHVRPDKARRMKLMMR
jgi:hypothetical protein